MNKELEEAIEILKNLKDKKIHFVASYFTTGTVQLDEKEQQSIETVLNYIENSIPKEKVEEKIKYIKEEGYWEFTTDRDADKCEKILKELLEGK